MSPLLGPILAQLVTLSLSDRTEGRYIASDDKYFEATTLPRAALNFGWKHTTLTLGYGPSLTVTPLAKDAQLVVFHNAVVATSYRWRRTTVAVSQAVGLGEVNFQTLALADARAGTTNVPADKTGTGSAAPTPPANGGTTGAPPPTMPGSTMIPGAAQIRARNGIITFATSSTTLSMTQQLSPVLKLNGELGYLITGSVGKNASADFPVVKGPRALAAASYSVTPRDAVTSSWSFQYAGSSTGVDSWVTVASEGWAHAFDLHTNGRVSGGLSMTRTSQPDGLIAYSIYPTFSSAISHATPLDRGTLSYGFSAGAAPVLDPVRALVDPRVNLLASLGWGRDRFSTSLSAGSLLSLDKQNTAGALSSASGALTLSYRLADALSVDGGVRTAWQRFEGQTTVPLSWAAFVGLTYGVSIPFNGGI